MPICSYLVVPADGTAERVRGRLAAIAGCEVACARNRDLLILVTDTAGDTEERALQSALAGIEDIRAMGLAFGALDT